MYPIGRLAFSDLPEAGGEIRAAFGRMADDFGLTEEQCPTKGAFFAE